MSVIRPIIEHIKMRMVCIVLIIQVTTFTYMEDT